MMLSPLSEAEFANYDPVRRIIQHENARRFASVKVKGVDLPYAISWCSDSIEPSVEVDNDEAVAWLGVDEQLVAVNNEGRIVFSLMLGTPLLQIVRFPNGIIVICELQAIAINRNCTVRSITDFPDIVEDFHAAGNHFTARFMDGTSMAVEV